MVLVRLFILFNFSNTTRNVMKAVGVFKLVVKTLGTPTAKGLYIEKALCSKGSFLLYGRKNYKIKRAKIIHSSELINLYC